MNLDIVYPKKLMATTRYKPKLSDIRLNAAPITEKQACQILDENVTGIDNDFVWVKLIRKSDDNVVFVKKDEVNYILGSHIGENQIAIIDFPFLKEVCTKDDLDNLMSCFDYVIKILSDESKTELENYYRFFSDKDRKNLLQFIEKIYDNLTDSELL